MAEDLPCDPRNAVTRLHDGGFTLIEMMAALGILVLGLTGLLALLGTGVSTRRTAELRNRATFAVDQVFDELLPAALAQRRREGGLDGADAGLPEAGFNLVFDPIPSYPKLKARVQLEPGKTLPELWRVQVHVSWREEGVEIGETFVRVVDFPNRWDPFPARVARTRSQK